MVELVCYGCGGDKLHKVTIGKTIGWHCENKKCLAFNLNDMLMIKEDYIKKQTELKRGVIKK